MSSTKIFSVADMVLAEKLADAAGHSYQQMMELAGRGVSDAIVARYNVKAQSILILVGPGNNGGDGLVAARHLSRAGANVSVFLLQNRPTDDNNFQLLTHARIPTFRSEVQLLKQLEHVDILVDALLGTGVNRPIEGALAHLLPLIKQTLANKPHVPVVAVDCPSGLNCDSGAVDPHTLPADLTVTFAGPKHGHYLFPGKSVCGQLAVIDIGIDPVHTKHVQCELAEASSIAALLPERSPNGHKGTFGSTLIVGGSAEYLGAPILSARAALRCGSGLVALAVPRSLRMLAATHLPEATFPLVAGVDEGAFSAETIPLLTPRFARTHSLLIGPGLGRASDSFLGKLLTKSDLPPLVIDADGLNYLAQKPDWWQRLPPNSILTPHPVEMGRLVGRDIRNDNRISLASRMAQRWGHIVVLKGAFTVIANPDGHSTLLPVATAALAVAGSGDVLAGAIAALLAQRLSPYNAAVAGAYIHAAAGLYLAQQSGPSGHLASEIADALAHVIHTLRSA